MPRPKKAAPPQAIVSSAAQVTSKMRRGIPKGGATSGWQSEAWQMLDAVGELEFYREWITNAMSRVTLYIEEDRNGEKVRLTRENADSPEAVLALDALDVLFDGEQGQSQMMGAFAGHLSIPGETWLVGLAEPSTDPGIDTWRVMSAEEVSLQGSRWKIDRGDGVVETYEDGSKEGTEAEAFVTRIWRPHPRKWVEAHSSVRSALPILKELVGLTQHTDATINSRLAGAGVLFVPQELSFTTPGAPPAASDDPEVDPFMVALTTAMTTALQNREDPSSLAPIVVRVPAQYLDSIKHITFWSEFSQEVRENKIDAIKRLAASLDVPAEVLLGLADVNHWTGWLLDENAIKMHIEPGAEVICHGLSTRFLWPVLQGAAATLNPSLRRFVVKGDTSALRQRPNRSAEAQALHTSLTITDAALSRETGFDSTDLLSHPDNAAEYQKRILQRIATGTITPDIAVAALSALGVTLMPEPSTVPGAPAPVEAPATPPALEQTPAPAGETRNPPEQAASARLTSILLGSEAIVLRAVERAWNRAGKRRGPRAAMDAELVGDCLVGAWSYAERIAAMTGVDEARLTATLDGYARHMLLTGEEHQPQVFAERLRDEVLTDA